MSLKRPAVLLILLPLLSGCAHYAVNAPFPAARPCAAGYRFQDVAPQTNSDDLRPWKEMLVGVPIFLVALDHGTNGSSRLGESGWVRVIRRPCFVIRVLTVGDDSASAVVLLS